MASAWVARVPAKSGVRYRVMFRLGGRESFPRHGGAFGTMREAKIRRDWIAGELASMRVPNLAALATATAPTLGEVAAKWKASRVDVSEGTRVLHRVALDRVLPILGERTVDSLTGDDVALLIETLSASGKKRETIRKSVKYLAAVLDFAHVEPNPARDKQRVRLPMRSSRRLIRRPQAMSKRSTGCSRRHTGYHCCGSIGLVPASHPSTRFGWATTTSATAESGCGRLRRRHARRCGSTCRTCSLTRSRRLWRHVGP